MIAPLLAFSTADVEPKIIDAAIYKNGYAMVAREVPITGKETTVAVIPQASLGTFWIEASSGVRIKAVTATRRDKMIKTVVGSFTEFLSLNKELEATIVTVNLGIKKGRVKVVNNVVVLESGGQTTMFPSGEIRAVTFDATPKTEQESKLPESVLQFTTEGTGKLIMYGLENNLSWVPGYALHLNDKKATLEAKATIVNRLGDMDVAEVRFVTGAPNIPWATVTEPLLSEQGIAVLGQLMNGPGGFGGRGGGQMMYQNQAPREAMSDMIQAFDRSTLEGYAAEDLFFYRQGNVKLKMNDRALYALFSQESDFSHLYTADLPNYVNDSDGYNQPAGPDQPVTVWHTIKFLNKGKQPLTTGPLTVYQNGQIVGQDTLTYTPMGADATVTLSKALEIPVAADEQEVDRKRDAMRVYGTVYDQVKLTGTVDLMNRKADTVTVRVRKPVTGEVTDAGGAKVTKAAKGLRRVNENSQLEWTVDLKPGEKRTLKYAYSLFQRM